MREVKKTISRRVYVVFFCFILVGLAICAKLLKVQVLEQDHWLKEKDITTRVDTVYGKRGDIYDIAENPLVISLPHYKVSFDPTAAKSKLFEENIQELSYLLAKKFGLKTANQYENYFRSARENGKKYLELVKNASLSDKKEMQDWPLCKEKRSKGGVIFEKINERHRPYGTLAKRTLGTIRENAEDFGLERAFDNHLTGGKLPQLKYQLPTQGWIEVNFSGENPKDGYDIHSTIDINIQDAADTALKSVLKESAADHGCAIVMDVATGEIRAIVNYGRDKNNEYHEMYNYAIAETISPGSTFKIAMLLALLTEKKASLNTLVDVGNGVKKFYDRTMRDSHPPKETVMTLQSVIETSSNVGVATMVTESFSKNEYRLIDRLKSFNLNTPCGVEILGEPQPDIPNPGDKRWSGVSLPWMSIGYELKLTPLQLLNFYSAIANDGVMMKPHLVRKVTDKNKVIEEFEPQVIGEICSEKDAYNVQKVLRGVVKRGTAKKIASEYLTLAGKTGTAIISNPELKNNKKYQASFVGYFPHENPKYSCIVVVNDPKNGKYYGSQIAAPVFKEIAEKTFAKDIELQKIMGDESEESVIADIEMPTTNKGYVNDLETIFDFVGTDYEIETNAPFVYPEEKSGFIALKAEKSFDAATDVIPNVENMGLRDAIFVLENIGLKVEISGIGKVKNQSKKPGESFAKGDLIKIKLG